MTKNELDMAISLDDFRPLLETLAAESGIVLDFLMQQWNGRFATYNIGISTETVTEARRGIRDNVRYYNLIGRLKATMRGPTLHLTFSPPTSCDRIPTADEQALWELFVQRAASLNVNLVAGEKVNR